LGDKESEEKFKEVSEAYEVLSDENKRLAYDQGGSAGVGSLYDLIRTHFNQGSPFSGVDFGFSSQRGPEASSPPLLLSVGFFEAINGCEKPLEILYKSPCEDCNGVGGSNLEDCSVCDGKGKRTIARGFFRFSEDCSACFGKGKKVKNQCHSCNGKAFQEKTLPLTIKIPAGIKNDQLLQIKFKDQEIFFQVQIENHPKFRRRGLDVFSREKIDSIQAITGGEIKISTVYGPRKVRLAPGVQFNSQVCFRGLGVKANTEVGNHWVTFEVGVPTDLSEEELETLRILQKARSSKQKG
jgi:molecular chaperone DnaJ